MKVKNIDVRIIKGDASVLDRMPGEVNEFTVRAACSDIILRSAGEGRTTVTLPALGCREGGFPVVGCAKIISQEVLRAGREGRGSLGEIVICLESDEICKIFEKQVFGYLRHVMEDLSWGPYVTTDIIIAIEGGIVIIERTNPPFGWALPGGFVDFGESLEAAARREAKEETNLELVDLKQFHTYSDPARDPRFHTVSTAFTAKGVGKPLAGDDAKGLKVVSVAELSALPFAFDHGQIIRDYLVSLTSRQA
jgi:8-oxo-dGTP diphosphatase